MATDTPLHKVTQGVVGDLEVVDGRALLVPAKFDRWALIIDKHADKTAIGCELYAVALQLMEAGQNDAAVQFGDLGALGVLPAVTGANMRSSTAGLSSAARQAVASVTRGLGAQAPTAAALGPRPTGGAGIGLRTGPKKR